MADQKNCPKTTNLTRGEIRFTEIKTLVILLLIFCAMSEKAISQNRILDSSTHYLRIGEQPEWDEFANHTVQKELTLSFEVSDQTERTISLRQSDVKQNWTVLLNDQKIGSLATDGNDMRVYFKILPERIKLGENKLTIRPAANIGDDIVISEITLHERPLNKLLDEAYIDIEIIDEKTHRPVPAKITIVDAKRTLQTTGTLPAKHLAIRPGTVYTGTGRIFADDTSRKIYHFRGERIRV